MVSTVSTVSTVQPVKLPVHSTGCYVRHRRPTTRWRRLETLSALLYSTVQAQMPQHGAILGLPLACRGCCASRPLLGGHGDILTLHHSAPGKCVWRDLDSVACTQCRIRRSPPAPVVCLYNTERLPWHTEQAPSFSIPPPLSLSLSFASALCRDELIPRSFHRPVLSLWACIGPEQCARGFASLCGQCLSHRFQLSR